MGKLKEVCAVCGTNQKLIFEYQSHYYYRCPSCGLVSTYPLPETKTIEVYYTTKFQEGYYRLLREYSGKYISVYNGYVHILERKLKSYGLDFLGLKVLDIGCSTGEFLGLLQNHGVDVYGLEIQREALGIANQRFPGRIFKSDVLGGGSPEMQFDIITLLSVIEHVIDPVGLLLRSLRLLRPGGVLMLMTPNSASFLARAMGKLWHAYMPIEHIHLFTKKSLELALQNLGLEDITYTRHWKTLPISYVYKVLGHFRPEFQRLFRPFYLLMPRCMVNTSLPFYTGEMIVTGRKI